MDDDNKSTDDSLQVTDKQITDGEIVSETPQVDSSGSDALILENLESMIRENLSQIEKMGEEAKKHKEMIESVLLNDETYQNHESVAKEAARVKNATKAELLKRPDVAHTVSKLKELQVEIKEMKESMNSYLAEYQRLSGSNEIEDDKGETMQLVYSIKLVRRKP